LLTWTAILAAVVNLDVAVVVAMPLALALSERRGLDPSWMAIAVADTANAASILLPTSNVTNLLVMQSARTGGAAYLRAAWPAWAAVAGVTVAILTSLVVRMRSADAPTDVSPRWSLGAILADLLAMFLLASALRSLLPSGLHVGGSFPTTVGGDGLLAAVVNNLPAAAAIHPLTASARWAGVLGMAIGPNLFLTGSVATVVCRRIAMEGGADLDPLRFTLVGLALVPLELMAGALALLATCDPTRVEALTRGEAARVDRVFLRENEEGSRIAPHLEEGEALLDLGAGTGFMARWLQRSTGVRPTLCDLVDYGNRDRSLPFIQQTDPNRVPVGDASFDVVLLMFVFHHIDGWENQERLLDEAVRIARRRVIVTEDTPASRAEWIVNAAWDWILNLRHGVPTPFTFRSVEQWTDLFKARDLSMAHVETYRPVWPSLGTYRHTLFVLDR
jgi:SAM-dependent methyltransferase